MPHPLDGARLKIIRAEEHVQMLKAEIAMYLNARPWAIGTETAGKEIQKITAVYSGDDIHAPSRGEAELRLVTSVVSPPPLRLSTIIGDCVTNARAALDYILWELVVRYFDPPFNSQRADDRRITAFPISKIVNQSGYVNRLDRLAKRRIPMAAIAEIKAVQPYTPGYEPLWLLHELVNTDKHRMPILTLAQVPVFMTLTDRAGSVSYGSGTFQGHVAPLDKTVDGKVATEVSVKMDDKVATTVTFKDDAMPRESVDRTLEQIIATVAKIIPRFEPFLTW
jgi:hypothetical protein